MRERLLRTIIIKIKKGKPRKRGEDEIRKECEKRVVMERHERKRMYHVY